MIISPIDREALNDAMLAISTSRFPEDIGALCYQLGEVLRIAKAPSITDVDPALHQLEASVSGWTQAQIKVEQVGVELRAAWSGDASVSAGTALALEQEALIALSTSVRDELAIGAAHLRVRSQRAAAKVDNVRLRMIRAFSLTPSLRRYADGQPGTARYAALFALVKTEAHQGVLAVIEAYVDFDQASMAFIDCAARAGRAIRPERPARSTGFLA